MAEKLHNFFEAWKYIKESRKYIYFAVVLFFLGILGGIIFSSSLDGLDDMLRQLIEKIKGFGWGEIIWYIFQNNSIASFLSMIFGAFFGIFSMFNDVFNGVVLGYVFSRAAAEDGVFVAWKILPHGIFELPAVMISIGLGLKLGFGFFGNFIDYNRKNKLRIFMGIISLVIGIFGLLIFISGILMIGDLISGNWEAVFSGVISVVFGLVLICPLFFMFFGNRELKEKQKRDFIYKFYKSMKVFFYIVLPLLVIAAIIEGTLIYFLR